MTLLDPGKANRCPKEVFMKVCKDIGCEQYSKKLFNWMDFNHSGDITLEEIDPIAYLQMQRGDHEMGLLVIPTSATRCKRLQWKAGGDCVHVQIRVQLRAGKSCRNHYLVAKDWMRHRQ